MTRFHCLSAYASLALAGFSSLSTASAENLPATITLGDLTQTYDGTPKLPTVTTDPPGLAVTWEFTDSAAPAPQPATEKTVYRNIPPKLELSYASHSFATQSTLGLGNQLQLADSARDLSSVDVILVSWAKAASYPLWSLVNPAGWNHPVTITVFDVSSTNVLTKTGEFTKDIFVPWRPLLLPNGQPYYYNGYAFTAHFDILPGLVLPANPMFMVSYNTQNSGFAPIGVPGPYNQLNVAIGAGPMIGTDVTPTSALWVRSETNWIYPARNANPPMFTVKAKGHSSSQSSAPPVNAGTWQVTATISGTGHYGETTGSFTIQPASAQLLLSDLTQIADGNPKSATIATIPADLPVQVTYDSLEALPTILGKHTVRAIVTDPNYNGMVQGELWLGYDFASWLEPWIQANTLNLAETGSEDDPDHDSINNLLEYAFALDPTLPASSLADRGTPRIAFSDQRLSLIYRKNLAATDLEYIVQTTGQLGVDELWEPAVTEDTVLEDDGTSQTIRATLPAATFGTKRFLRRLPAATFGGTKRFLRLSVIRH